jgi:hypothetical protein
VGAKSSIELPRTDEKISPGMSDGCSDVTFSGAIKLKAGCRQSPCRGAAALVRSSGDAHEMVVDALNLQSEIGLDGVEHVLDFTHHEYPANPHVR